MAGRTLARLRNSAATLLTISGISHIAALWFWDIGGEVLAGALFGGFYLIIGIGLYGQSRFALFTAIIVPATGAWLALNNTAVETLTLLGLAHLSIDFVVILFSAIVLFAVRNNPSS